MIVCGREISTELIHELREQAQSLSCRKLARWLCERLEWIGPNGRFQVAVGMEVLRKLQLKGLVNLTPQRQVATPARAAKVPGRRAVGSATERAICGSIEEIGPIELVQVKSRYSKNYRLWKQLLDQHHYLGSGPLPGDQLRYLIRSGQGWLGAIAFSAAARALEPRDRWIGWSPQARRENLHRVINNSRYLILPHVQVPDLASHVLAKASTQVSQDWEQKHGYRPLLVESFVEIGRHRGICYSAVNWQAIGMTCGRGRQDRAHQQQVVKKAIWVYPLSREFRQQLCQVPENPRLVDWPKAVTPVAGPAQNWLEEEFGGCYLKDRRLEKRLQGIARDFSARPQMDIPQACGSRAKVKAVYRFFDHPRVNLHSVLEGHYQATARRARQEKVVLAMQDTTDLNYSAHPKTELLGPICDKKGVIGLKLHDTMLYNLEGTPLGLIDVQCWSRDPDEPSKHQRSKLPIDQKESAKWLRSFQAAEKLQQEASQTMVVSVGDREADIYELFAQAQADERGPKLLVRARQERFLQSAQEDNPEVKRVWQYVHGLAEAGSLEIKIPRQTNRPPRVAKLSVRFASVELKPTTRHTKLAPVKVWAISAIEQEPPAGVEPVRWFLLTTVPVETFEEAVEKLRWYAMRFQIEVYHRTLKSGCKIEQRQLGNADRIEACLAIDMIVAWRIVHLTKLGREVPDVPCTVFFEEAQWKALEAFVNQNPHPPQQPPTLREAVRMMAMTLGGFLGRKSDGEPGAQTIWRGLQRLDDVTHMWCVFQGIDWIPPTQREFLDSS